MPTTHAVSGLFLTPGAGSDSNHPSLMALEERLAPLPVERMGLYADERRPI